MNKKYIFIISLLLLVFSLLGCSSSESDVISDGPVEVQEIDVADKAIKIEYEKKYEENIFGNLTLEEIDEVIDSIYDKLAKDSKYIENTNLAIEEVFIEYNIGDKDNLETAKNKIIISLNKD